MINLSSIGSQVNRALDLSKRSRAIGLFMAVISRLDFSATDGDVRFVVRINFHSFRSRARIPNRGIAAAHPNHLIWRSVRDAGSRSVAIQFIEFRIASSVNSLDVLSL